MKRCNFLSPKCCKKISIIGNCIYCEKDYCLEHRLPEMHNCVNMDKLKEDSKYLLKEKLIKEMITDVKINKV